MEKSLSNILYGQTLKEIRKNNHLTQEQSAELVGLDSKTISQIECGFYKVTIDTMLKFCKIYNCTPNEIFIKFIDKATENGEISQINDDFTELSSKEKRAIKNLIKNLLEEK